ncbi:MAG: hypoxanthine-DNA glycosylase [Candidatus Omnitrophota bacterium]|jgi:hypoxanthine-DNA glycosylase
MTTLFKGLAPIKPKNAQVLILGSMASPKSLEFNQYYGHPQNLFWKIIFEVFGTPYNGNYKEKLAHLIRNKIALWDTLAACQRKGAADSTIKDVKLNDIPDLLKQRPTIEKIVCNGKASAKHYTQNFGSLIDLPMQCLPSTSPANAAIPYKTKLKEWKTALIPSSSA